MPNRGRGEFDRFVETLEAAAALFDAFGARFNAVDSLAYLGLTAGATGDRATASALCAEVLARLRPRGSPLAIADGLAAA